MISILYLCGNQNIYGLSVIANQSADAFPRSNWVIFREGSLINDHDIMLVCEAECIYGSFIQ